MFQAGFQAHLANPVDLAWPKQMCRDLRGGARRQGRESDCNDRLKFASIVY